MSKISVIVPVYKAEPYIHRCVDSILAQTFRDFDLILVDDGSPDRCGVICDEYAEKDSRIVVIHQKNGGLSAARNAGIDWSFSNSSSQWISFIDSDDSVELSYLTDLYNAVQSPDVDVSIGCFRVADGQKEAQENPHDNKVIQISGKEACRCIYNLSFDRGLVCSEMLSFVNSWNKLYKKSLFSDVRFPVGKIHEDQGTTYKVFYQAKKVAIVDKELYNYTVNPGGITHCPFNIARFDDIDFLHEAETFFLKNGETEIAHFAAKRRKAVQFDYTVQARKAGFYRTLPPKYKLGNFLQQAKQMEEFMGRNEYEYFMYSYYPKFVKLQCYLRRIKQIFFHI